MNYILYLVIIWAILFLFYFIAYQLRIFNFGHIILVSGNLILFGILVWGIIFVKYPLSKPKTVELLDSKEYKITSIKNDFIFAQAKDGEKIKRNLIDIEDFSGSRIIEEGTGDYKIFGLPVEIPDFTRSK